MAKITTVAIVKEMRREYDDGKDASLHYEIETNADDCCSQQFSKKTDAIALLLELDFECMGEYFVKEVEA